MEIKVQLDGEEECWNSKERPEVVLRNTKMIFASFLNIAFFKNYFSVPNRNKTKFMQLD